MLVQDRSTPKPPKSSSDTRNGEHRRLALHPAKNLDFSAWFSDNLYKILAVFLLVATVAAIFFLRSAGDTAALLCFEKTQSAAATASSRIAYPQISWNSVRPLGPSASSSPYASFRSDRWIVVSVSSPPSDSLRALAHVKGWQLLAVGNSHTPPDWSLKGAIFLSLEQQALLGFRTVDFLPYDSHVRKSVGYLFAIQHGAGQGRPTGVGGARVQGRRQGQGGGEGGGKAVGGGRERKREGKSERVRRWKRGGEWEEITRRGGWAVGEGEEAEEVESGRRSRGGGGRGEPDSRRKKIITSGGH